MAKTLLIDINPDVLKFIIDPKYEDIEDKISIIREEYIREYGEEYRTIITERSRICNYVLLNKVTEIKSVIKEIKRILANNIYRYIIESVVDKNINDTESEIIKILNKNSIELFKEDEDLRILRTEVLNLFLKTYDNEVDKNKKRDMLIKINYIETYIKKYDNLNNILNVHSNYISLYDDKIRRLKDKVYEVFVKRHSYLLKNIDDTKIFVRVSAGSDAIGIGEVFVFDDAYVLKQGSSEYRICLEYRKSIMQRLGISFEDEELRIGSECLNKMGFKVISGNITYYGEEGLKKFKEEIKGYNDLFKIESQRDLFMMSDEEFFDKNIYSNEFINRKCNDFLGIKSDKDFEKDFKDEEIRKIGNSIHNAFVQIRHILYGEDIKKLIYMFLPTTRFVFSEKDSFSSFIDYIITHEYHHLITVPTLEETSENFIGFSTDKEYINLRELITEYVSSRIVDRMHNRGIYLFDDANYAEKESASLHFYNKFLIEPFMNNFEYEFKEANINFNIDIIKELMGEDVFERYINIIDEFYNEQSKISSYDCLEIFKHRPEYIEKIKKEIDSMIENIIGRKKVKAY